MFLSDSPLVVNSTLEVQVALFSDGIGNPATDQDSGRLGIQRVTLPISRKPAGVDVPLSQIFAELNIDKQLLRAVVQPTSVHVFLRISALPGASIEMNNMTLTVIEMKKSF